MNDDEKEINVVNVDEFEGINVSVECDGEITWTLPPTSEGEQILVTDENGVVCWADGEDLPTYNIPHWNQTESDKQKLRTQVENIELTKKVEELKRELEDLKRKKGE